MTTRPTPRTRSKATTDRSSTGKSKLATRTEKLTSLREANKRPELEIVQTTLPRAWTFTREQGLEYLKQRNLKPLSPRQIAEVEKITTKAIARLGNPHLLSPMLHIIEEEPFTDNEVDEYLKFIGPPENAPLKPEHISRFCHHLIASCQKKFGLAGVVICIEVIAQYVRMTQNKWSSPLTPNLLSDEQRGEPMPPQTIKRRNQYREALVPMQTLVESETRDKFNTYATASEEGSPGKLMRRLIEDFVKRADLAQAEKPLEEARERLNRALSPVRKSPQPT